MYSRSILLNKLYQYLLRFSQIIETFFLSSTQIFILL